MPGRAPSPRCGWSCVHRTLRCLRLDAGCPPAHDCLLLTVVAFTAVVCAVATGAAAGCVSATLAPGTEATVGAAIVLAGDASVWTATLADTGREAAFDVVEVVLATSAKVQSRAPRLAAVARRFSVAVRCARGETFFAGPFFARSGTSMTRDHRSWPDAFFSDSFLGVEGAGTTVALLFCRTVAPCRLRPLRMFRLH